jgi:uncharacterized protein (DUF1778 family)
MTQLRATMPASKFIQRAAANEASDMLSAMCNGHFDRAAQILEEADRRLSAGRSRRSLRALRDRVDRAVRKRHISLTFEWSGGVTAQVVALSVRGAAELETELDRDALRTFSRQSPTPFLEKQKIPKEINS